MLVPSLLCNLRHRWRCIVSSIMSVADLPSAEQADLVSAKQEQHERDISVPYPEVDDAPAKKSSVPPPMRDKIPATATASKDGGVEQEVVPTTKKGSSLYLISMLKLMFVFHTGRINKHFIIYD